VASSSRSGARSSPRRPGLSPTPTQLAANRSQFYRELAAGPFYGFNRPGVEPSEAIIQNWWRQGMMGGAKAHYDGIVAFSQTDFTEDLKKIAVQVLVMHSKDDQIVPYEVAGPLSAKLLQNATFKSYEDLPHEPRPSGCAAGGRHVPWSAISRQTALASVQNVSSTTASVAAAG
jgi:pimeloyl-ACP methyl ester carboxylesterase